MRNVAENLRPIVVVRRRRSRCLFGLCPASRRCVLRQEKRPEVDVLRWFAALRRRRATWHRYSYNLRMRAAWEPFATTSSKSKGATRSASYGFAKLAIA